MSKSSWQSRVFNRLLQLSLKKYLKRQASNADVEQQIKFLIRARTTLDKLSLLYHRHYLKNAVQQRTIANVPCKLVHNNKQQTSTTKMCLYLHGGAYVIGSSSLYLGFAQQLSLASNTSVLLVDYRLLPEYSLQDSLADALAVYKQLLAENIHPADIIIGGDSAGGGLAVSLLLEIKRLQLPNPRAGFLICPWLDFKFSGASAVGNADHDPFLFAPPNISFLSDDDIHHPAFNSLSANLADLPQLFVQVSDIEILYDDSTRFVSAIEKAHGKVEISVWKNMPHVWHLFGKFLPEAKLAMVEIGNFIKNL